MISVIVQSRVAHGVMIDKNLKAKELCTAGTKEDPLYGCQNASSRASSMSRLFRDNLSLTTPPVAGLLDGRQDTTHNEGIRKIRRSFYRLGFSLGPYKRGDARN